MRRNHKSSSPITERLHKYVNSLFAAGRYHNRTTRVLRVESLDFTDSRLRSDNGGQGRRKGAPPQRCEYMHSLHSASSTSNSKSNLSEVACFFTGFRTLTIYLVPYNTSRLSCDSDLIPVFKSAYKILLYGTNANVSMRVYSVASEVEVSRQRQELKRVKDRSTGKG